MWASKIIFIFAIKMHLQWKTFDGQILDKLDFVLLKKKNNPTFYPLFQIN